MKSLSALALAMTLSTAVSTLNAAEQAAGITLNSGGIGINYSRVLSGDLSSDNQFQLRGSYTGANIDADDGETELNDIDYDVDIKSQALQLGVDWYPFSGRVSKSFFVSGGLSYYDFELDGTSERLQAYTVGATLVQPSDEVSLHADVEQESVAPYLSVGWGNRLHDKRNWYFQGELGIVAPFSDPDVKLTATDPNNVLSAADIAAEQRELEEDFEGLGLFASMSVNYRF